MSAAQPKPESLSSRLVVTAVLLLLALGAAALARALFHESGSAALSSQVGRARVVKDCTGFRTHSCDVSLQGSDGNLVPGKVSLHTSGLRPDRGDIVRVRYRVGNAVPDTLPERVAHLGLMLVCALVAVAALGGSVVALLRLRGRILDTAGVAALWAIGITFGLILLLRFISPSAVVARVPDVTDPYAEVASEPDRTVIAQGVRLTLVGNRLLAKEVCARVPFCLAAASGQWTVTGTDLESRSWIFVFADEERADAAVSAVDADPGLVGEPLPKGWAAAETSPGRYLVVVWIGRPGGGDISSDPVAKEAALAVGLFRSDAAVAELIREDGFER